PAPSSEAPVAAPLLAKKEEAIAFTHFLPLVSRLDDHRARHVRMKRTKIAKLARLCEREGEGITGIQHLRLKQRIFGHDGVRNIVAVGPGYGGSRLHGDHGLPEREIVDADRFARR